MTHRSATRRRPAGDAVPRSDIRQKDKEARTSGGWASLLESATQEILAVTYWFDPAPHAGPYPVTVRFSGHHIWGRHRRGERVATSRLCSPD